MQQKKEVVKNGGGMSHERINGDKEGKTGREKDVVVTKRGKDARVGRKPGGHVWAHMSPAVLTPPTGVASAPAGLGRGGVRSAQPQQTA